MIISTFAAEMLMMFQIVPIMWRAVRPSRIADMPAVVNTFWLRKGYEGLTFFGQILAPTQQEADRFNAGASADRQSAAMKNHEMIHLRQAQACHDSWVCFYLLYLWYWLKGLVFSGRQVRRQLKHAAYLLNPFEMEAYRHMNDPNYLARCEDGAQEWRKYAKMSIKERLLMYRSNHKL